MPSAPRRGTPRPPTRRSCRCGRATSTAPPSWPRASNPATTRRPGPPRCGPGPRPSRPRRPTRLPSSETTTSAMAGAERRQLGRLFDEVPELYDRVRPTYPDELFADLVAITGLDPRSSVLEVGCGTGQATRSLAALGCSVTAVEQGPGMAALARERLAGAPDVVIETSSFEQWDDRGRRFDLLVAASAWHWVDPAIGWPRAP